jgi:hypothetical protein
MSAREKLRSPFDIRFGEHAVGCVKTFAKILPKTSVFMVKHGENRLVGQWLEFV